MTLERQSPAPIWKRVIAGCIDYLFIWLLLLMPLKLLLFGDIDNEIDFARTRIGAFSLQLRLVAVWLFPFCLRDLFGGRGLGKWLVGIRVVDAADLSSTPSVGRLLLRNVTIWISPVGLFSAHMHPDRMRFGDRLAGTMVVEEIHDPASSVLARRLLKGALSLAAMVCCALSVVWMHSTYIRNSKVHEVACEFIARCQVLQETFPGLSTDKVLLTWPDYAFGDNAVIAGVAYRDERESCTARAQAILQRGLEADEAWRGVSLHAAFDPALSSASLSTSALHRMGRDLIVGYPPLQEAIDGVSGDELKLTILTYWREKDCEATCFMYEQRAKDWQGNFRAVMKRAEGGAAEWKGNDAEGYVTFKTPRGQEARVFAFVLSRDFHRFLTKDEVTRIFKERKPAVVVIPELKEAEKPAQSGGGDSTVAPPEGEPRP